MVYAFMERHGAGDGVRHASQATSGHGWPSRMDHVGDNLSGQEPDDPEYDGYPVWSEEMTRELRIHFAPAHENASRGRRCVQPTFLRDEYRLSQVRSFALYGLIPRGRSILYSPGSSMIREDYGALRLRAANRRGRPVERRVIVRPYIPASRRRRGSELDTDPARAIHGL